MWKKFNKVSLWVVVPIALLLGFRGLILNIIDIKNGKPGAIEDTIEIGIVIFALCILGIAEVLKEKKKNKL